MELIFEDFVQAVEKVPVHESAARFGKLPIFGRGAIRELASQWLGPAPTLVWGCA
jgi:hypothetical protein